jgi:hypothetical protein
MSKLRTALGFSGRDWWFFGQAWALLVIVDVGLWLLPFPRLRDWAAGCPRRPELDPAQETELSQHLWRLVDIAARNHLYPMSCLRRTLALQRLLAGQGVAAELRLGVRKDDHGLSAHAWLEVAGQPLGEPETISERFAPLKSQT